MKNVKMYSTQDAASNFSENRKKHLDRNDAETIAFYCTKNEVFH